jgi:diguanylate cyclase (GGDEF)-like protein
MRLVDAALYGQLKTSGHLPSPKGVAFAVIQLLQRDDYKIDDLIHLVRSDPAIAGRLLKFANVAKFGGGRPVVSIAKAVMSLGAFRVRDLVLGFSLLQGNRGGACRGFDYPGFWSRALATAIAAQALTAHSQIAAEESFTLGLLSDVGKLALASLHPDRYCVVVAAAGGAPQDVLAAERRAFAMHHRELGATMLTEWGLPNILASAAYHVDAPDAAGFPDGSRHHVLTLTLNFAQTLAEICVAAEPERWTMMPQLYTRAARLGINPDELGALADGIVARWREWGQTLEIKTRELPSFAHLLSHVPTVPVSQGELPGIPSPPVRSALLIAAADDADGAAVAGTLAAEGYGVRRISGVTDGLVVALRDTPELILVAIGAGEGDALAFCRDFRESTLSRDTRVILIGGRDEEVLLLRGMEAGADDFLLRPVTESTLKARLRAIDKSLQLREEIRQERRSVVRTAHEWASTQRRLMLVALTDPLTNLPNRRHGMDYLAAEWVFSNANNQLLGCLMVDIDHFKKINDSHGHEAGDEIITQVARLLQVGLRAEDMAFRYGGEEFCIVSPGSDGEVAHMLGERIRQSIEAERFEYQGQAIAVTVSIGLAVMLPGYRSASDLIRAADAALYRAKQAGRNRVEAG